MERPGFPEEYDILPHPLRRVGAGLVWFFSLHQLASHGDHKFEHPLDTPAEPVTDWPEESDGIPPRHTWEEYGQMGQARLRVVPNRWDGDGRYMGSDGSDAA